MIYLDMVTVLTNARSAYDQGDLQMQKEMENQAIGTSCSYASPCAIGASLTSEQAQHFDNIKQVDGSTLEEGCTLSVLGLVDIGELGTDNLTDLEFLQRSHDSFNLQLFDLALKELEERYGLRPMDETA